MHIRPIGDVVGAVEGVGPESKPADGSAGEFDVVKCKLHTRGGCVIGVIHEQNDLRDITQGAVGEGAEWNDDVLPAVVGADSAKLWLDTRCVPSTEAG